MPPPRALVPSGAVLVDKPEGPSSFALVRQLRDETGARAGHAGTLDPFASGLLIILLGSATRLARYLVGLDKRYITDVDVTARTSTGDREGKPLAPHGPPARAHLEQALAELRGEVELRVPAASAVKIDGKRAYRLARRGVAVDMPVRTSTVHSLELVAYNEGVARLDLRVSSGTYVRALADAIGGHCRTLRRLEVGPFSVDDANPARIVAPAEALEHLPAMQLSPSGAAAARAGRAVTGDATGPVRLLADGRLVAVGRGDGREVRPETVLPA
jgi:tRNA pseudouridine55 synthase